MHRTLIYALGGGKGHVTRGLNAAVRLGGRCTVLHQAPGAWPEREGITLVRLDPGASVAEVQRWLLRTAEGHDRLLVDTFPGGIAHELPEELFERMPAALMARALIREQYPDYDALAARFDEVWLPYPADRSEWEEPPVGQSGVVRWIGPFVRPIAIAPGPRVPLLAIGDPETVPEGWRALLRGAVVVNGPFDALPAAERTVALSAGYNLAWELHVAGIAAAYRPLPRRFDDQHRRAALLGTLLCHREDLERFLRAPGGAALPQKRS